MEDAIVDYRFNDTFEGYDSDVNNAVENVQEAVSTYYYTFHTHTLSLSLSRTLLSIISLPLSLSLSHTHIYTVYLIVCIILDIHAPSHTHAHSFPSLSQTLSIIIRHTNTHTHSHTHTHTHTPTNSLTHTHTHTHLNLSIQFDCCGVDNATDWIRFNLDVYELNGDEPPFCDCTQSDGSNDGCIQYIGTLNGVDYDFQAWEDVSGCVCV